jgi:hypothetical protein
MKIEEALPYAAAGANRELTLKLRQALHYAEIAQRAAYSTDIAEAVEAIENAIARIVDNIRDVPRRLREALRRIEASIV